MIRFNAIQKNLSQKFHRKVGINILAIRQNWEFMSLNTSGNGRAWTVTVNSGHILNVDGLFFG